MQEEIRKILAQYADEQYKEFSAGLIPGAKPLIGVRLPKIRQLAKSIVMIRTIRNGGGRKLPPMMVSMRTCFSRRL